MGGGGYLFLHCIGEEVRLSVLPLHNGCLVTQLLGRDGFLIERPNIPFSNLSFSRKKKPYIIFLLLFS